MLSSARSCLSQSAIRADQMEQTVIIDRAIMAAGTGHPRLETFTGYELADLILCILFVGWFFKGIRILILHRYGHLGQGWCTNADHHSIEVESPVRSPCKELWLFCVDLIHADIVVVHSAALGNEWTEQELR